MGGFLQEESLDVSRLGLTWSRGTDQEELITVHLKFGEWDGTWYITNVKRNLVDVASFKWL